MGLLLKKVFSKTNTGNAILRTTTVPTMAKGGSDSPNVLPDVASVTFNCRILPGETVDGVLDYFNNTISNPGIKIEKNGI